MGSKWCGRASRDHPNNVTRFVVMSREPLAIDPGAGPCVTAYVFEVKSVPAALYKGLGGFATNGVNLSKIESYLDASFSVAEFYIEFEGHRDSPAVRNAVDELGFFSNTLNWLGTWSADPFRRGRKRVASGRISRSARGDSGHPPRSVASRVRARGAGHENHG